MKPTFATLDEYLDALDVIKEKVAEETRGMTPKQVKAHFAGAKQRLEAATGQTLRLRRGTRKVSQAKR